MAIFGSVVKKILGSKYERDMKLLRPIVEQVKAVYPEIEKLSNDELRGRTITLKKRVSEAVKPLELEIESLKEQAEN